MFSRRLHWDLRPNPLAKLLAAKRARGANVLDLTESNPTQAGFKYPTERITQAFADPRVLTYDPNPSGLLHARQAVAADQDFRPDRILLTTSTSEAYAFLFKLLTDPGDEVLVPRPSYPLFEFLAGMELVNTKPYSLRYHGHWEIDFETIHHQTTERTRAIVLVNPNNPTGSSLNTTERQELVSFCAEWNIAIISDEVFAAYSEGLSLRRVNEVLTFCLGGLSKSAGLPQMKLGWILASGPEPLVSDAMARLELIADTYLSVGTPVQIAAPDLLTAGRDVQRQIRKRTARNLAALRGLIGADAPFRVPNVEGGWYAIIEVPRIRPEEEWALGLLEHRDVLVQPGFFYDFESEAFLVVSLICQPDVFDEGILRVLDVSI